MSAAPTSNLKLRAAGAAGGAKGGAGGGMSADGVNALKLRADAEEQRVRLLIARKNKKFLSVGDYAGAKRNRTRSGLPPRTTSADFQLDSWTREKLNAEVQRLLRNSPIARAMVRRIVDRSVGEGLKLQVKSKDKAWSRDVESKFACWGEHCADVRGMLDVAAMQRVGLRSVIADGDVGFIKTAGLFERPEDVLRLQAIEASQLSSPGGIFGGASVQSAGTGKPAMVAGVELNAQGRPIAYHVANYTSSGSFVRQGTTRIAAEDFIYLVQPERFTQTRGETRLAALITMNDGIKEYIEATLIAARVGASQAAFIKSNLPSVAQASMLGSSAQVTDATTGQQQTERYEQLQAGMIRYLAPGEDIGSFKPEQPTTQFDPFVRMMIRIAATDFDMPIEMALLDHSQSTAYAGRAALATVKVAIGVLRKLMRKMMSEVYRQVVGLFIATGQVRFVDDWESHAWIAPADPTFEPDREIAAAVTAIENNLMSKRTVVAGMGFDLDEVLEQRREEKEMEAEMGVTPPGMPGQAQTGPAGAAAGADVADAGGAAEETADDAPGGDVGEADDAE